MSKAWINITNYVDIETGLVLDKKTLKQEYDIIRKETKIKYNGKYNIKQTTVECRKGIRLF